MTSFRAERSPMRQFMFGVAGLVLILAAIDILWAHKLSEPPTTDDNGARTSRGNIDRRHDLMWGTLFILIGGGTMLVSVGGLLSRKPMLELDESGVSIRLLRGTDMMRIPFHRIVSARSGFDNNQASGVHPRQILITVDDPSRFSDQLWGAEWDGSTLRVDTEGWSEPAEEIAVRIGIEKARADARAAPEEEPAN